MGNTTQSDNLQAYVHSRLGPIKRIQEQYSAQYIQYCVGVQSQKLLEQWKKDVKQLKDIGAEEFLFLPIDYAFDKTAMCGTGGNINIKYEDYMFSLAPEIKNRRDIKRPFKEEQVWIGALTEKRSLKIGDVRPQNILLNEDGQFKLICSQSWPGNPDNNQLIMEDPDARVLLSPEECQFHNKKKGLAYPDGLDFNACEVFSMGITVLEAGTLQDCYQGLYERTAKQWRFNQYKVRDFTNILQERYSKELAMIIQEMLKISPDRRIRCSTIMDALAPYKSQITNIEPFTVDRNLLYQTLEVANKERSSKAQGKSSLSGIINNQVTNLPLKNGQSTSIIPPLQQTGIINRAQHQSSPRNLTTSMKTSSTNIVNNTTSSGLIFSFQSPPQIPIQQQPYLSQYQSTKTNSQTFQSQLNNYQSGHINRPHSMNIIHQTPMYHYQGQNIGLPPHYQPVEYYQQIEYNQPQTQYHYYRYPNQVSGINRVIWNNSQTINNQIPTTIYHSQPIIFSNPNNTDHQNCNQ